MQWKCNENSYKQFEWVYKHRTKRYLQLVTKNSVDILGILILYVFGFSIEQGLVGMQFHSRTATF
jgi:hypothetical protein